MEFMKDVLVNLVHISLLTGPMIVIILLIHWLAGRRLSGRLTYGLWLLVLLRMLLPIGIASPFSIENAAPEVFEVFHKGEEIASKLADNEVITYGSLNKEIYNYPTNFDRWMSVLAYIWLFGIFAVMFFPIISYITLKKAIEEDESAIHVSHGDIAYEARKLAGVEQMEIKYSYYLDAPALIGVFRPMIILPANMKELEEDKLLKILLHEMIHYRRQHLTFQWIFWIVKAVYWFNPLLWIGHEWMKLDGEFACDEEVIRLLGHEEIAEYGHVLLDLSEGSEKSPYAINAAGLINRDSELKRRIIRLGRGLRTSKILSILTLIVMIVMVPVFFTVEAKEYESFEAYIKDGLLDFAPVVDDGISLDPTGVFFDSSTGDLILELHYEVGQELLMLSDRISEITLYFELGFPKSFNPDIRTLSREDRVTLDVSNLGNLDPKTQGSFEVAFQIGGYDPKAFGKPVLTYEGGEVTVISDQMVLIDEASIGQVIEVDKNLSIELVDAEFGSESGCSFGFQVDMVGDYDIHVNDHIQLEDSQGNLIDTMGYGGEESENYFAYDVDSKLDQAPVERVCYTIESYIIKLGNWVHFSREESGTSWEFSIERE